MSQRFRLLTEDHVKSLLPMPELVAAMEGAVARFSAGEVLQPVRSVLMVGPTRAYFGLMPAYVEHPARLGAKIVTVFNENHKRGLPSHLATIVLLDPETGALLALLDGRYITEARTAAWESPFDYSSQALLYVPRRMPGPNTEGYTQAVVDAVGPILKASGGRAFLLFTSLRAMREAHRLLRERLEREQLAFPLLLQGEGSRSELLERFRRLVNAVLVGSQSFW